jgi:hypothetical protein
VSGQPQQQMPQQADPWARPMPLGYLADISNQTKKGLIDIGEYRPEDFRPQVQRPVPMPQTLGGDPTRRVTQAEYDKALKLLKKQADEKYRAYKKR